MIRISMLCLQMIYFESLFIYSFNQDPSCMFTNKTFTILRKYCTKLNHKNSLYFPGNTEQCKSCRKCGINTSHLFGRRLKSSQIGATFITIFLKCANIRRVLCEYYFINLCVSPIYEAGQKDIFNLAG